MEETLNRIGRIVQGDCIAEMQLLGAGKIDLAFADPPFNIGYDYDVYDDTQDRDAYLTWSRDWIDGVHRSLKPNGTFWLAIGDEYAAELKLICQNIGFHCRSWVVWYYTFGVNCKNKFSRSHAHLFHFVKDPNRFTFRADEPENRIPSARQLVYSDTRANPKGRLPDDTWILRPQDLVDCFSAEEDTWYFPRVAGTFKERAGFHGCQMPEQLLGRIIRTCSNENDIVLDPFAGSATTLVVAKKLGRQFLGIELSAEYAARGSARLENVRRGDALEGSAEPTVSAPATPNGPTKKPAKRNSPSAPPLDNDSRERQKFQAVLENGLIAEFARTCQGYSVDRMIADPVLGRDFATGCRRRELPGDERTWRLLLLQLRKAGQLSSISMSKRTELPKAKLEAMTFASEIAMRMMFDRGCNELDELLADPLLADQFDGIAKRFAPGYDSLEYRWAALKQRRDINVGRKRVGAFVEPKFLESLDPFTNDLEKTPQHAGLYLIESGETGDPLYVGEASNLRQMVQSMFASQHQRQEWKKYGSTLRVSVFACEDVPTTLTSYKCLAVSSLRPRLNVLK